MDESGAEDKEAAEVGPDGQLTVPKSAAAKKPGDKDKDKANGEEDEGDESDDVPQSPHSYYDTSDPFIDDSDLVFDQSHSEAQNSMFFCRLMMRVWSLRRADSLLGAENSQSSQSQSFCFL